MGTERHKGRASLLVCGSVALCISVSPLAAQTPPEGKPATPPEVMEPPSENQTPPTNPDSSTKPKEPLSKQLREGEGVLEPPKGIDPGIQKDVPKDFKGRMPVIPPPGEPGGNPDVRPK